MSASAPPANWSQQRERGNAVLTQLMVWLVLRLGWPAGQLLLLPITAWFIAASRSARAASHGFLERALGHRAGMPDVWRHFFCFANVVLDRLFMLTGATGSYQFEIEGLDVLRAELDRGRGCVLLGSHLGSFGALQAIGADYPQRIRPMMYRANAAAPTRLLERLNPRLARDIIELGTLGAMLEAREAIGRGEVIGILGDRAHRGERSLAVSFLGRPASFPTGPLLLAGALGTPIFLFFAPRIGPRRYRIVVEPFDQGFRPRNGDRDATIRMLLEKYVARLEHHCRAHPFNWFNFFDFWGACPDGGLASRPAAVLPDDVPVAGLHPDQPGFGAGAGAATILARDADAGARRGAPAP